jgi:hypothetical protein
VLNKFAELEARLPASSSQPHVGSIPDEAVLSTFHKQNRPDKGDGSMNEPDLIHREGKFHFPRQDCPDFEGDNPVEWVRKCSSYFTMHQISVQHKTYLATLQFYGLASDWYDGYLMDHDPPDWDLLVKLVHRRFIKPNAKSVLED